MCLKAMWEKINLKYSKLIYDSNDITIPKDTPALNHLKKYNFLIVSEGCIWINFKIILIIFLILCLIKTKIDALGDKLDSFSNGKQLLIINLTRELKIINVLRIIISIFIFGFIGLVSIVCIVGMINIVLNSLGQRKREMAVLRSVGMSKAMMIRMLLLENLTNI